MISKHNYKQRTTPIIIGERYGRLTVLEKTTNKKGNSCYYRCKCDCGKTCEILSYRIGKSTMSCGCYKNECIGSHKESGTRLYNIWTLMKRRCQNPKVPSYVNYGGRGIKVCEEWETFLPFRDWSLANGYTDELTIDRIDVNGDYEPSNCRWATKSQQAINRRPIGKIPYDGITPDRTGYRAQLMWNGRKIYIGHATTIKRAVDIRNEYILKHHLPHKINQWRG